MQAYKIYRPMTMSSQQAAPLVVLHGGPSVPSDYLYPLTAVVPYRTIIFYDQLGCGKSDEPEYAPWYVRTYGQPPEIVCVFRGLLPTLTNHAHADLFCRKTTSIINNMTNMTPHHHHHLTGYRRCGRDTAIGTLHPHFISLSIEARLCLE